MFNRDNAILGEDSPNKLQPKDPIFKFVSFSVEAFSGSTTFLNTAPNKGCGSSSSPDRILTNAINLFAESMVERRVVVEGAMEVTEGIVTDNYCGCEV
jgi:hypothetical protein